MGARHTIEINEGTQFTLFKDYWDSIYIEKLKDLTKESQTSEAYAILLHGGLANICMIRNSLCIVKSRIETNIPSKGRGGSSQSQKVYYFFHNNL